MVPGLKVAAIVLGCLGAAWLGAPAIAAEGIYTCIDAKGRRLTSDRPIVECLDREQRELNPGGTVRRKIGPSLTADERAAEEEKERKALEERNRVAEDKRRERALLTRYPDKAAHDKERVTALTVADGMVATARKRMNELFEERKRLDAELEFFGGDAAKAPAKLKRQLDENASHMDEQMRFIVNQADEKKKINARFDEELAKLNQLWALRATPVAVPASATRRAAQP
jgi:hypothetical protein